MNAIVKPAKVHADWTGGFWKGRWDVCRDNMVPHMWDILSDAQLSHCWQNFLIASGEAEGNHSGPPFHDGDFYKWFEAAARVYGNSDNKEWNDRLGHIVSIIARCQRPDGYIFTYHTIKVKNGEHYEPLSVDGNFEVYNLGHLMIAAVVYHEMTGKRTLLDVAEKAAAYLHSVFPDIEHALKHTAICPTHYMGLAHLHEHTGKEEYIELLDVLIKLRDHAPHGQDDNQDLKPLKQHREIVGHGVRSTYLYAGLTDLYREKGDQDYKTVLDAVWNDLVSKKIYIHGGCGALYSGTSPYGHVLLKETAMTHQSFGRAYELPQTAGYNETCASIGNYLWNYRMAKTFGEGKYGDYMERALYNSILSGVDLDGDAYFYQNALRVRHDIPYRLRWERHRTKYLTSFCCPPNVVRTIARSPDHIAVARDGGIAFLIYGDSRVGVELENGAAVQFKMTSDYPWDGDIELEVERDAGGRSFPVSLRIPEWARSFTVAVNGEAQKVAAKEGFVSISRAWQTGDKIKLVLPMQVEVMESHPMAEEQRNHVALMRGPILYCLEAQDFPGSEDIEQVYIDPKSSFTFSKQTMDGAELGVLKGDLFVRKAAKFETGSLYRPLEATNFEKVPATLVPYFAWDNREHDEMTTWLPLLPRN
jgi:DUF1680 family protein